MWLSQVAYICNLSGKEDCCNPYTNKRADEEDVQMEDVEEEDDEGDEQDGIEMDDIEDGFNQDGEGHEVIDGGFEDPDYACSNDYMKIHYNIPLYKTTLCYCFQI